MNASFARLALGARRIPSTPSTSTYGCGHRRRSAERIRCAVRKPTLRHRFDSAYPYIDIPQFSERIQKLRVPVIATAICLLAVVQGVGEAGRAAAQASPPPLLARDRPERASLPTTSDWTINALPVAARSNAVWDGDRADSHRMPLVAGVLGIVPGLGHVYAGEPGRGLLVAGV